MKDEKGFFKSVTTAQVIKGQEAFNEMKSKVQGKWPKEIAELQKQLDTFLAPLLLKTKLLAPVYKLREQFLKFKNPKGELQTLTNLVEIKALVKNFAALEKATREVSKDEQYLALWEAAEDKLFDEFLKIPQSPKSISKVVLGNIERGLTAYFNLVDQWNIELFADASKSFYNTLLLEQFKTLKFEINRLRVNSSFIRYEYIFGPKADKEQEKAGKIEGPMMKPLLKALLTASIETAKEQKEFRGDFAWMSFETKIKRQLYSAERSWKAIKNKVSKEYGWTVAGRLDAALDAYREYMLEFKEEFDRDGFIQELENVSSLTQLRSILRPLVRKKVDQAVLKDLLSQIKEVIDEQKILSTLKKLLGKAEKKDL